MLCKCVARWMAGVLLALSASPVMAQTGDGALRGYVKDESQAILPGVTVTATSPELLVPVVSVTDETGLYRLNRLPPGTYVLTAELTGFSTTRREGILIRAGQTFTIDVQMGLSTLQETVTVTGDSPMIETSKATTSITLDRDLIRAAPVTSRRLFSDALDLAPGISSRNVDDGVGRRAYYFKGAVIFSHVFTLEGAPAGSFLDSSAHSIGFGGDTVQDTELKLAGVDPAAPTGTGVVMNIMAPRGGNQFRGAVVYDYQSVDWNADNTKGGSAPGGNPTAQSVNQVDFSLGGPIVRDKVWFFGSFRKADLSNGISRSEFNLQNVQANDPTFQNFDNFMESNQPFVKVTAQISSMHEVVGFYQNDRSRYSSNRELDNRPYLFNSTGGGLYHGRVNSVWTNQLTTSFAYNYNDKRGNDEDTYADLTITGPQREIHQNAFTQQGIQVGTGSLADSTTRRPSRCRTSSMTVLRGDLTYYQTGWKGGHEFRTGIWAAPRMIRETTTQYPNGGFVASAGPLHERRRSVGRLYDVPPAVPVARPRPDHPRARQGVCVLRSGRLDAEPAPHRERRRPRGHQPPVRRDSQHLPSEGDDGAAESRRVVPAHRRRSQRHPRQLRAVGRAGERPRLHGDVQHTRRGGDHRRLHRSGRQPHLGRDAAHPWRRSEPAVRSGPAPAVRRRDFGGLQPAAPRPDERWRGVHEPALSGQLRGGRHQRHLPGRARSAVRRIRVGGSRTAASSRSRPTPRGPTSTSTRSRPRSPRTCPTTSR